MPPRLLSILLDQIALTLSLLILVACTALAFAMAQGAGLWACVGAVLVLAASSRHRPPLWLAAGFAANVLPISLMLAVTTLF